MGDRAKSVTYAPDHVLVRMDSVVPCGADSGSGGPKVLVKCNATFSGMYSVAAKNENAKKYNGYTITITITTVISPSSTETKSPGRYSRLNCQQSHPR